MGSHTVGAGSRDREKARRESIGKSIVASAKIRKEIEELKGSQKVKYDLDRLKSQIVCSKSDLAGMFKGNAMIEYKLKQLEEAAKLKEKEYNDILLLEKSKENESKKEEIKDE